MYIRKKCSNITLAHLYLQQQGLNIVQDLVLYTGDATLYVHVTSHREMRAQCDLRLSGHVDFFISI